ncbi:MAG: DEAD/DEAH box helicase family protein [Candidatus Bathyarchaeia archaeon]
MPPNVLMPDSFAQFEQEFKDWLMSRYTGSSEKTIEFIEHLLEKKEGDRLWQHQKEAILRVIFSYEIKSEQLGQKYLLRIVTGGGKSLIIASIIGWLKYAYGERFNRFLIITPNLIVRDRLEDDFRPNPKDGKTIFERWSIFPEDFSERSMSATVLESGSGPQGMLSAEIIIANIQELYVKGTNTARNLSFIRENFPHIAIFNDEAHNTVADEFTRILSILKENTLFRLDTTATPERADGTYPDSRLIYSFDITDALDAPNPIIKNIVVLQPDARVVEITYTNAKTNEKKKISEMDEEFREAEKRIKPFQWVMDPAPMRMMISIAKNALDAKKREAGNRYKPLLFVVTMGIEEAKVAKDFIEKEFGLKTLIVTEESTEEEREAARYIGHLDSPYDAVVSVFMLREGWDVSEVSVILLLRRIISPVFGKQIIGRGLRKVNKKSPDPEILHVIDHPMMDHGWLWRLMNVSRIRQDILPSTVIEEEALPPRNEYIQKFVNPDKFIKVNEPVPDEDFAAKMVELRKKLSSEEPVMNWREVLDSAKYSYPDRVEIETVVLESVRKKVLGKKSVGTEIMKPEGQKFYTGNTEYKLTIEDFKDEVVSIAKSLIEENYLDISKASRLYDILMDHISKKFFHGLIISEVSQEELDTAYYFLPTVKEKFTSGIIKGIFMGVQQ